MLGLRKCRSNIGLIIPIFNTVQALNQFLNVDKRTPKTWQFLRIFVGLLAFPNRASKSRTKQIYMEKIQN